MNSLFNKEYWKKKSKHSASKKRSPHKEPAEAKPFAFSFHVIYRVFKSLFILAIVALILFGSLGLGIGAGYFAYLVSDTDVPQKEELKNKINDVEQVSHMVYAGGESIGDLKSDLIRTTVSSENISPLLKKAIISTEDEYFYEHNGVVPKAVIRALVSDATGFGGSSGGSTLTQQLVKQQVLTSETTFKRKANEILLALRVEKFFSKDEIITSYLNVSPFGRNNKGQNIAGVQEAAKGIFGLNANELSLPQAAFIAGLPQSPIVYNPYTNTGEIKSPEDLQYGLERKNDVLFNMYREKLITKEEYDAAVQHDIVAEFRPQENASTDQNGYLYYYLQSEAVKVLMPTYYQADNLTKADIDNSEELRTKYQKIAERELRRNGYTVHSTIDKTIYDTMQQATSDYGYLLDENRGETVQTGSVLLDNRTGKILGFIAGRNYEENQNNHAFDTKRSPGSTMKPILAYGPAIDIGLIGSESQLSNFPSKYRDGTPYTNYGGVSGNSFVTVRDALKTSKNIPVNHLYQELLTKVNPEDYFKKMNISIPSEEYRYESAPLGSSDLTVLEQTGAYATLANGGVYNDSYAIEKITDNNGNIIYEHKPNPVQVYSKATASIMNDLMRDVIRGQGGTAGIVPGTLASVSASLPNADWVGKTGTSQFNTDYWFTASTPAITMSSWMGYDNNIPMYNSGGQQNMKFWAMITNAVYQSRPELFGVDEKFTLDPSVIKAEVSNFTGEKLGNATINNYNMQVPGTKVMSYYAVNGPPASQFKFGIGGTDANYATVWAPYLKIPVPPKKDAAADKKKAEDEKKKRDEEQKRQEEEKKREEEEQQNHHDNEDDEDEDEQVE